jgi:hypothetical protein
MDLLDGVRLLDLAETRRHRAIDRQESYYRCTQDDHKQYDWDGMFLGYGAEADIAPGWFVPYKRRKPSSRYDLAKVVVNRLTSMLFGSDRFPELRVPGDSDAEDYVKALSDAARLPARMAEARSLGGACGSVCLSWGFVRGRPRVDVLNAKHCTVLRWADRSEMRVGAAIQAYRFPRQIIERGKVVVRDFYYARFWDERVEIVWDPMPMDVAASVQWRNAPSRTIAHGFGFCPFYWVQNLPDSQDPDGESDYEGLCDTLDEINQLLSATSRGTKSNVDPTLVVKASAANNDGVLRRGSDNVIWSEGGAEYLELRGGSTQTALQLLDRLRAYALDSCGVVLADPEKLSGAAQSAQALRILYAPMLAKCDLLREQYTEFAILPILRDMLSAARTLGASERELTTEEGERVVVRQPVKLPPKVSEKDGQTLVEERSPGASSDIVANWNPYFAPTWNDIKTAAEAAKLANGGKPVISQHTSVASVQTLFGVDDVAAELERIHEDSEQEVKLAQKAMGPGPEPEYEGEEEGEAEAEGEEERESVPPGPGGQTAEVEVEAES